MYLIYTFNTGKSVPHFIPKSQPIPSFYYVLSLCYYMYLYFDFVFDYFYLILFSIFLFLHTYMYNHTAVYVISCRFSWLQYRFSKMADVRDSNSWVHFHLQTMACSFTPSGQSQTLTRWEKNGFYDFPILFAQFDLLSKNLTERNDWLAESWNEVETWQGFLLFCLFNIKYCDSFTIYHKPSPWISPHLRVLKAQRNRLGWWYARFKISVLKPKWQKLASLAQEIGTL